MGIIPFDFLITDLKLPGIPGIALCGRIRNDLKQATIQLVLLVAKGVQLESELLKSSLNITEIISKPFSIHDLTFLREERSSSMFSPSRVYQP